MLVLTVCHNLSTSAAAAAASAAAVSHQPIHLQAVASDFPPLPLPLQLLPLLPLLLLPLLLYHISPFTFRQWLQHVVAEVQPQQSRAERGLKP
jgi:hypothetical protein